MHSKPMLPFFSLIFNSVIPVTIPHPRQLGDKSDLELGKATPLG